uniref:Uncharacterized protein n=1 Tax=Globodera rostochiensis TaxID=31243 RepID=A0A914GWC9_GLORO
MGQPKLCRTQRLGSIVPNGICFSSQFVPGVDAAVLPSIKAALSVSATSKMPAMEMGKPRKKLNCCSAWRAADELAKWGGIAGGNGSDEASPAVVAAGGGDAEAAEGGRHGGESLALIRSSPAPSADSRRAPSPPIPPSPCRREA